MKFTADRVPAVAGLGLTIGVPSCGEGGWGNFENIFKMCSLHNSDAKTNITYRVLFNELQCLLTFYYKTLQQNYLTISTATVRTKIV